MLISELIKRLSRDYNDKIRRDKNSQLVQTTEALVSW